MRRHMKLRQIPEDFKVDEINEIDILRDKGAYKVYSLEKKGIETFSLLRYLSGKNKVPVSEFGIAGLKDRHAFTKQYFTIPSKYSINTLKEENFSITFLGYANDKIKLGSLAGNKFEIVIRDIKKGELEGISKKAKYAELTGVPNYFDNQRFGSVIDRNFIAKYLLKKDYEMAVKAYLTLFSRHENSKIKEEKRYILKKWGNINNLKISSHSLAKVIGIYARSNNWLEAYKAIAPSLREIFISAYQSYLWNECIKEALRQKISKRKLYHLEYNVGSLIFYKGIQEEDLKEIPETFKTISEIISPSEFERSIINKVLEKESVSISQFGIKKETGNFFKTHERKVIIKPMSFAISDAAIDELNDRGMKNRFKVALSFILPKGSYATIITRRIVNR